ncbi:MAG: hypothetical protein ED558_13830 [Oricola sp.]|nr:MAG: hypothetical protein ED558_13830 [Oricola sp.]
MGLIDRVSDFIAKHGQAATLIVPSEPVPDGYGGFEPGTPSEHAVTVVTTAYTSEEMALYGGLIARDDLRVYLAPDAFAPAPTTEDEIRIGGTEYRVIRVAPMAPDGEAIVFDMQVREDG